MKSPIRWFGGKHNIAKDIWSLAPRHIHYVEPFFGGGSLLFARDPDDPRFWLNGHKGVSELVNDLDGRLVNFWRVLQDDKLFARFHRQVQAIPWSRDEWRRARRHQYGKDRLEDAVMFFLNIRMSFGGDHKGGFSASRRHLRTGMNQLSSSWMNVVDGLPEAHARLRRVLVEDMNALRLIPREDGPNVLFVVDPPYLPGVRSAGGYAHEMTYAQHRQLLLVLKECKGKIILCGYPSKLYYRMLGDWNQVEIEVVNGGADRRNGTKKATEILWLNYDPAQKRREHGGLGID